MKLSYLYNPVLLLVYFISSMYLFAFILGYTQSREYCDDGLTKIYSSGGAVCVATSPVRYK